MAKYINPMTDFGFKYLFGREESKEYLIDMLNSFFADNPDFEPIVSLEYRDKEKGKRSRKERGVIYDIYCTTSNGKQFIVEMQTGQQSYYIDRAVYYGSKAIVEQGRSGATWMYQYMPIYLISFMNFESDMLKGEFRTDAALCNLVNNKPISNKIRYIFIQLPLFDKNDPAQCRNGEDQWIYIFKNMDRMETMPFTDQRHVFSRFADMASYASMSEEDRREYDADLKAFRDKQGELAYARMEAHNQGIQEGIQEGEKKHKVEMVHTLYKMGMPLEKIAEAVKLPVEKITAILQDTDNPPIDQK